MTKTSFAELTNQVHMLNDLILSDTVGKGDYAEEIMSFSRRLFTKKYWFVRTSWRNKRRYVLALLSDLNSVWALSLLLKSLWNCRPKDAILSASSVKTWSSYDQVPMDHNRTAQPAKILGQVMTNDRKWFHSLEPEQQAIVLLELLMLAGGPLMWEVLQRGRHIYEVHRDNQLRNLLECIVVEQVKGGGGNEDKKQVAAQPSQTYANNDGGAANKTKKAQKELEVSLAAWNLMIKTMQNNQKLEEVEMSYKDGSKMKIWKVNRSKPEAIETVDFIQLLPSYIGKKILSLLPPTSLSEYAKVNRYWAFLVDELRSEKATRARLDADMMKLQDLMLRHDTSLEVLAPSGVAIFPGSVGGASAAMSVKRGYLGSMRPSERSAGGMSFRLTVVDKLKPAYKIKQKPIKNLSELDDRLELRGAADENLWQWCENALKYVKGPQLAEDKKTNPEGVIHLPELHFPCWMMKFNIELPLETPLYEDPAEPTLSTKPKTRRSGSSATFLNTFNPEPSTRRFSLWSRNFSSLYKVFKVASYEYP